MNTYLFVIIGIIVGLILVGILVVFALKKREKSPKELTTVHYLFWEYAFSRWVLSTILSSLHQARKFFWFWVLLSLVWGYHISRLAWATGTNGKNNE